MSVMIRGALLAMMLIVTMAGCTMLSGAEDASGVKVEAAMERTLKEQYSLAGKQFHQLNDALAEIQVEIFDDVWLDGSVRSEVIPGQGGTRSNRLHGATNDNSYYFSANRWHGVEGDSKPLLREVATSWTERGWEVSEELIANGLRITTDTEHGIFLSLLEEPGRIRLTAFSPVYWGDQFALVTAISDRRDAENEAGATWDTTDRDENGHAYRLPGVYRPFPAWDAVPEEA